MFNKKIVLIFSICLSAWEIRAEEIFETPHLIEELEVAHFENEVETMDHLIAFTEKNLIVQKKLRNLIFEFKKMKDCFFKGDQTKKHSFKMVKTASQILQLIHENYFQQLYSPEYLEELALFSSIAEKNKPVCP